MNLIQLSTGKPLSTIQYTGDNLQEVVDWGNGQIVNAGEFLVVYNPKDFNQICQINQWCIKLEGNFIWVYNWDEIKHDFVSEFDRINTIKGLFDELQFETIKAIYDEFNWRYNNYIHDKFVAELVFFHYIARIKFIGLPERIEDRVIDIFKSIRYESNLLQK